MSDDGRLGRADSSGREEPLEVTALPPKTEAEIEAAAACDIENPPITAKRRMRLRRVPRIKTLRRALGLTQEEFAKRYDIPIGTLRDWEQGRTEPDQAARAYLDLIAREPRTAARLQHGTGNPTTPVTCKRFYVPVSDRLASLRLTPEGYLPDPQEKYTALINPDLIDVEELRAKQCAIILGEPGMGKTTALKAEEKIAEKAISQEEGKPQWIDLRSYGDEQRLLRDLFYGDAAENWRRGSACRVLFLDGLDECRLLINHVGSLLADEIQKHPIDRLWLRIACRGAEWPDVLGRKLRQLYGERFGVYRLAPLRRRDIVDIAHTRGAGEEFVSALERARVGQFAANAMALDMLLKIYDKDRKLPTSRWEIFERGCLRLVEERNSARIDSGHVGNLSDHQRVALAGRIAAAMLFSNKSVVRIHPDDNIPDGVLDIGELVGGDEEADGNRFPIGRGDVEEVLKTGLFTPCGGVRVSWAHQSYAEFLAARWVVEHSLSLRQILSLIMQSGWRRRRVAPQIRGAAAWIASRNEATFAELLSSEPTALLAADLAALEAKQRAGLVERVLGIIERGELPTAAWGLWPYYQQLAHPDLAQQLRPYIKDSTKNLNVRYNAILIARECNENSLVPDLVAVATDRDDDAEVRSAAIFAIGQLGDTDSKRTLASLLADSGPDPKEDIKGNLLALLWPECLTASELFARLTQPRANHYVGSYQLFIGAGVIRSLKPEDLPVALEWASKQNSNIYYGTAASIVGLVDKIVLSAVQHLLVSGVIAGLTRVLVGRLRAHVGFLESKTEDEFRRALQDDTEGRRIFLEGLLAHLTDDELYLVKNFVFPDDHLWLINKCQGSNQIRSKLARLAALSVSWEKPAVFEAIFEGAKVCPELAREFEALFKPVELGSPEAERWRRTSLKVVPDAPKLSPPPEARVAEQIDRFEAGDLDAWWRLTRELTLTRESTHYGSDLESDITRMPGWNAGDDRTRRRILAGAKIFVDKGDPQTAQWLGTNKIHQPAWAGYRALQLLLTEAPDELNQFKPAIWSRWAPILLGFPVQSDSDKAAQKDLVGRAYSFVPDDVTKSALRLIEKEQEATDSRCQFVLDELEECWNEQTLQQALAKKVRDTALSPQTMGCVLRALLRHGVAEAIEFAASLISVPLPDDAKERERSLVAAEELALIGDERLWAKVWSSIQSNQIFGRELVTRLAGNILPGEVGLFSALSEESLADLYIWLEQHFPRRNDPDFSTDTRTILRGYGPRDCVPFLRDGVLAALQQKATRDACAEIERIKRTFPGYDWLTNVLALAEEMLLSGRWIPAEPVHILKLASDADRRIVNDGNHLLEIVIDSLGRLQKKLQESANSVAQFLWDGNRPKDEPALSAWVAEHFEIDIKSRALIVNREVEIKRSPRGGRGLSTDIDVAATAARLNGSAKRVKLIVEVKGCWNPKLKTELRDQLWERYLKQSDASHGIYMIGWFERDAWDPEDHRRRDAQRMHSTVEEASAFYEKQARDLSLETGKQITAFIAKIPRT